MYAGVAFSIFGEAELLLGISIFGMLVGSYGDLQGGVILGGSLLRRGSLLRGSTFFFTSDGTGTCIGCASCSFLVLSAVIGTVGISLRGFPNTKLFSREGELSGEEGVS